MNVIPGVPGQDYPILSSILQTSFSCEGKVYGGYYADLTADCQVFHVAVSQEASTHFFAKIGPFSIRPTSLVTSGMIVSVQRLRVSME